MLNKQTLVPLYRSGVCTVSGTVKSITRKEEGTLVILTNRVPSPVSGKPKTGKVEILFDPPVVDRMKLKEGSFIIATVEERLAMEIIANGGECEESDFKVKGYNLRYTGEFSFRERASQKEQHVIAGTVVEKKAGGTGDSKWCRYEVMFRSSGQNRKKRIVAFGNSIPEADVNDRCIFVTGKYNKDKRDGSDVAWAQRIVSM